MLTSDAPVVWNMLKGVICVYKPADVSVKKLRLTLIKKICQGLNELNVRPPIDYVTIEGNSSNKLSVSVKPSLADHPLVVGPRYQANDLLVSWANYLGWNTSGVLIFGLRSGTKLAKLIRENHSIRVYTINGRFGQATDNAFKNGKVMERSTFTHVRHQNLDRYLSAVQAAHQKKMFDLSGVDIQSQAAYDLAAKGLIRATNTKLPMIYGIKCIEFQPPDFTLEIQCMNENETYLMHLIHEIGIKLHSTAHCTGIKCIRHNRFSLEHALLPKHWDLQNILNNLSLCKNILEESGGNLPQKSASLVY